MVDIKSHKKQKGRRNIWPWPRKFIPEHTIDKCPYCKKKPKNVEAHIKISHKSEKGALKRILFPKK